MMFAVWISIRLRLLASRFVCPFNNTMQHQAAARTHSTLQIVTRPQIPLTSVTLNAWHFKTKLWVLLIEESINSNLHFPKFQGTIATCWPVFAAQTQNRLEFPSILLLSVEVSSFNQCTHFPQTIRGVVTIIPDGRHWPQRVRMSREVKRNEYAGMPLIKSQVRLVWCADV